MHVCAFKILKNIKKNILNFIQFDFISFTSQICEIKVIETVVHLFLIFNYLYFLCYNAGESTPEIIHNDALDQAGKEQFRVRESFICCLSFFM